MKEHSSALESLLMYNYNSIISNVKAEKRKCNFPQSIYIARNRKLEKDLGK